MDNKKHEKDKLNLEYDKNKIPNDYNFLVKKLRSIREIIHLIEKNFLDKEI